MKKNSAGTKDNLKFLTTAQRGIYFAHLLDKSGIKYNTAHYRDINGELDCEAFSRAVDAVLTGVPTYCSKVVFNEEIPCTQDLARSERTLGHLDFSQRADPLASAVRWMECERNTPFDLENGPLFRTVSYTHLTLPTIYSV